MKKKEFKYVLMALIGGMVITGAKFFAYFQTHSLAILSDALESIVNVIAAGFAFFSIYLAAKPKDYNHPYGHGKVEFFSIGFEGGMITVAGLFIIYNAIQHLIVPEPLADIQNGIYIILGAGIANLILGGVLVNAGKHLPSITLYGDGKHLLTDAWSSLGILIVLILIRLMGFEWIDPIASFLIGLLIIRNGYTLMRKSISGLMDETDMEIVSQIVLIFNHNRKKEWIDVHNLRIQQFGSNLHIDCHVTFPYYFELKQVHAEVKEIEQVLSAGFPKRKVECFIHADPCLPPRSCPFCMILDCPVREAPFEKEIPWTGETILENKQHLKVQQKKS